MNVSSYYTIGRRLRGSLSKTFERPLKKQRAVWKRQRVKKWGILGENENKGIQKVGSF